MEFTLNGVRHALDAETVRSALCGGASDDIREHWVDVDGDRWPPKQALALATGLDRREYTSHFALRLMQRLGFETSAWSGDRRAVARPAAGQPSVAEPTTALESDSPDQPKSVRIVLVGCSQSKAEAAGKARDLFTGPAFRKARASAEASGAP